MCRSNYFVLVVIVLAYHPQIMTVCLKFHSKLINLILNNQCFYSYRFDNNYLFYSLVS